MSTEPTEDVILVRNQHVPSCGSLPEWARERPEGSYFGYFEIEYGEQWVFLATEDYAQLAGGHGGWEHVYRLEHPDWHHVEDWLMLHADLDTNTFRVPWPGIVFNKPEGEWLWAAAHAAAQRFSRYGYGP